VTATAEAAEMARIAALAADDKLAGDVVILDVSDQLYITDCFVIASAPNVYALERLWKDCPTIEVPGLGQHPAAPESEQ
jgi:ribosome-associated protein